MNPIDFNDEPRETPGDLDAMLEIAAGRIAQRELDRELGDVAAAFSAAFLSVLGTPLAQQLADVNPMIITLAGTMAATAVASGRKVLGEINGVPCDLSEAYAVAVGQKESGVAP